MTKRTRESHPCPVVGCKVPVSPRMAMCRWHWYMVPIGMRRAVWAAYVPGQESLKNPSREYLEALMAALTVVREEELEAVKLREPSQ